MRIVLSIVLLTGLALVSQGAPDKPQPAKPSVPVLRANAVMTIALKQVTSASPELGFDVATPVTSLEAGLLQVKKTTDRSILAMAERGGWFFYATSVVRDEKTDEPVSMISGYAIKRDGWRVIRWSVW
jgi:hypothetical protein